MKKSARKLISLVLSLILICACATVAFATENTLYDATPNDVEVTVSYKFETYLVYSSIFVNDKVNESYAKTSVTYKFYPSSGTVYEWITLSDGGAGVNFASVEKSYFSGECLKLDLATFKYDAYADYEDKYSKTIANVTP